ncbi:uncharacterized protein LOC128883001 [Hylaeus volcanicus]|uniref:uncharacterized protein LOC128883001 n=1 Tax=Hylaeus volcanicus TaxID=313075 RepID=UPI0023B7A1CE|nr:uncharacterized protein LOC128883001 [Hylaeus volcanicus]
MYFTYVVRPGEAPEGRGPQFQPFWDHVLRYNLRGGFALELFGYSLILISALLGGNIFYIVEPLIGSIKELKDVPIILTLLGTFFYTVGAVWLQNFGSIADDDGSIKHSRGFRAGIKILHQASLLEIISWSMTTISLFSFVEYFEDQWSNQAYASGSTALYGCVARSLHALSLLLYSCSLCFLENFHTEGTGEVLGWLLCLLYQLSGIFELLTLITGEGKLHTTFSVVFTLLLGFALILSFFWSLSFEHLLNESDVKLTQSAMRNEFYKSRNAMAYYGPPTCVEMQEKIEN